MNKKQKTCILLSIAVIVVMGLFPPWLFEVNTEDGPFVLRGIYAWIETRYLFYTVISSEVKVIRIDWARLIIQFLVVACFTSSLVVTLGEIDQDRS